jgi:hypothetical protein
MKIKEFVDHLKHLQNAFGDNIKIIQKVRQTDVGLKYDIGGILYCNISEAIYDEESNKILIS